MPFERAEFCKLCKTKHDPRESLKAHARLWRPEMARFGVPGKSAGKVTGKGKAVAKAVASLEKTVKKAVVSAQTVAVAEKPVEKTVTPEKVVWEGSEAEVLWRVVQGEGPAG